MDYTDNFSEILLLAERPVTFYLPENTDIIMRIPPVKDFLNDIRLQYAISITYMDLAELQSYTPSIKFDTFFDLLQLLVISTPDNEIVYNLMYFLNYCFGSEFKLVEGHFYIGKFRLDAQWFDRIVEIVHIAVGLKKFNEQSKFSIQKPAWLIEQERKIRRIKSQGKVNGSKGELFQQTLRLFIQLNCELGYTFEELFNMNYYHLQQLQSFVPKIITYDFQKRAAAAGNMKSKKIKYITD